MLLETEVYKANSIGDWSNSTVEDSVGNIINSVLIFEAYTLKPVYYNGRRVFGLLQVADTVTDGQNFYDDSIASDTQVSFCYYNDSDEIVAATLDVGLPLHIAPNLLYSLRHLPTISKKDVIFTSKMTVDTLRHNLLSEYIVGTHTQANTDIELAGTPAMFSSVTHHNNIPTHLQSYNEYITFLLQSNSLENSTTMVDNSRYANSITNDNNEVKHRSYFGKITRTSVFASYHSLSLQHNDSLYSFSSVPDFTVDFWIKDTSMSSGEQTIAGYGESYTSYDWRIKRTTHTSGGSQYMDISFITPNETLTVQDIDVNGWHHFAFVCNSSTLTFYVNGVSSATTTLTSYSTSANNLLKLFKLGSEQTLDSAIQEFRIMKGHALWTSNFTPPTRMIMPAPFNIRRSSSDFINDNDIEVLLNGEELTKGTEVTWQSPSKIKLAHAIDPGDRLVIKSYCDD